jgi:hypothetical protein
MARLPGPQLFLLRLPWGAEIGPEPVSYSSSGLQRWSSFFAALPHFLQT